MPPLSAYTPFESLLFFQCLASLNTRPTNFAAISDTLRKNQFIKEDDAFDTNRLSPQALEELYTTLLQEGIDDSLDKNSHLQDGGNTNPKKRKIISGTTGASQSHAAIIPELVSQLYARYKDRVTKEIRDEEKRYRDISQEIERLQKDALQESAVSAPPVQKATAGLTGVAAEQASDKMDLDIKEDAKLVENAAPSVPKAPAQGLVDVQAPPTVPPEQKATPSPPVTTTPIPKPDLAPPIPDTSKQHEQTSAVLAPKEGVPQQLQPSQSPQISQPQPQQLLSKQAIPGGQIPPITSTHPIRPAVNGKPTPLAPQLPVMPQLSPNIQVKVPPPPQPQRVPPHAAPRGAAVNRNQPNLPPGSTIVFQAQQGTSLPATPTSQRQVHAGGPGFGRGTPVPVGSPAYSQLPQGQQQFQQWAHHPQAGVFPATPHGPPPYSNQPMMPKQGTFVPHADAAGKPVPIAPQNHGPATPAQFPHAIQTPLAQMHSQTTPFAVTPSFSELKQQRPHRPSIDTAGSLTPWKRTPNLYINIPDSPGSPPRPKPEDVSPISERAPSPIEHVELPATDEAPQKKHGRGRKRSVPPDAETVTAKAENLTATSETRRAGSTASTRTRARSVASRDDESASELATAQRKIKHEAPSTPAEVLEDVDVETRAGARRRGAAVGAGEEGQAKTRAKRKRGASEALEIDTVRPTPSRGVSSQLVYCTRNFTRTGAPIMNDVAAHKHASIFAKPLTEREAPGYKDLIYRPQDLKSIKSALNQGNRAVAAATEAASSNTAAEGESPLPGSGTPSKHTAWLPKTPELIPPKAIVNSSQLEKELIRMFANAIMFNPAPDSERGFGRSFRMVKDGESTATTRSTSHPWDYDEGGIIHDTREMCDDVEKAVTKWRAAERTTTTDEATNKSMLSLRGSSGDSNADALDGDHK